MRSALKELETHKYLVRRRTKNELGQFEYMYIIYEVPYTENQRADKRNAKKQSAGNDSQISKEKKNKEKINKDISNKEDLERFYGLKEQKSLEKFRKVQKSFCGPFVLSNICSLLFDFSKKFSYNIYVR